MTVITEASKPYCYVTEHAECTLSVEVETQGQSAQMLLENIMTVHVT